MSSISPLNSIGFYAKAQHSTMNETAGSVAYRNKQSSNGETAGSASYENQQAAKNETAGSVGFRGKSGTVKNVGKDIMQASDEVIKKLQMEALFEKNPAEAREVMMREMAAKMPEAPKKKLNIKI